MERKCSFSIYSVRVCSYLFFSSVVLAHLFRRETWMCKQRGSCTGTLLSASGRAVQGSRMGPCALYPLPSGTWRWAQGRRAWRGWQSLCRPRRGGTGGGSPAWGSSCWAHGKSLWLQRALPLRVRILPSLSLALTVQSKLIYLQFAAGFKVEPC